VILLGEAPDLQLCDSGVRNSAALDSPAHDIKTWDDARASLQGSEILFPGEVYAWLLPHDFELFALAILAEQVLLASPSYSTRSALPLYIKGGVAWAAPSFVQPRWLYTSPYNPAAAKVAQEMAENFANVSVVDSFTAGAHWVLFLSAKCFEGEQGERLAFEVLTALQDGRSPLVLFDPDDCDLTECFSALPRVLVAKTGLQQRRAVEWRMNSLQVVSINLLAQALGAQMDQGWLGWCHEGAHNVSACSRFLCSQLMRGGRLFRATQLASTGPSQRGAIAGAVSSRSEWESKSVSDLRSKASSCTELVDMQTSRQE